MEKDIDVEFAQKFKINCICLVMSQKRLFVLISHSAHVGYIFSVKLLKSIMLLDVSFFLRVLKYPEKTNSEIEKTLNEITNPKH